MLVVDDNPANTMLVRRILNRAGLDDVRELQDPLLVARTLVEYDPDLVLLDLRMPVMDGFEVLSVIRRQAAGAYLPVVVVTADDSHGSVERALDGGAHDFVCKALRRHRGSCCGCAPSCSTGSPTRSCVAAVPCCAPGSTCSSPTSPASTATRCSCTASSAARSTRAGFAIALQPVVDMRDGSLVGVEALSRFPADVLSGAGAWFAAALEVGLATELELAALRKALALLPGRPEGTSLSVNASPATVLCGLVDVLPGVAWDKVVLELTEHVPVDDYAALNAALAPLREAGARVAIDDAGSGFASLRHILDLHPDVIKIDIAITRGVDTDPSRARDRRHAGELRRGGGHRRRGRGGRDAGPGPPAARARRRRGPGRPPRVPRRHRLTRPGILTRDEAPGERQRRVTVRGWMPVRCRRGRPGHPVAVTSGASGVQVRAGSASRPSTRRPLTSETPS